MNEVPFAAIVIAVRTFMSKNGTTEQTHWQQFGTLVTPSKRGREVLELHIKLFSYTLKYGVMHNLQITTLKNLNFMKLYMNI